MERDKEVWKSMYRMLKQVLHNDVYGKLKISYDSLQDDIEKTMFLDVACCFIGYEEEYVISLWEACGFEPKYHLAVLKRKSLLKISEREIHSGKYMSKSKVLLMHDQIRDMGRRIANNRSPTELCNYSRIWSGDNIMKVLNGDKRNKMDGDLPRNLNLNYDTKIFQKMPNLRLLRVDDATLEGNFQCLPPTLRWLGWCYCPLEKLPSNFYHEEIVMLDLSHGCFKLAWSDWLENKLFQRLKVLKLSYCQNMSESLDFSGFPQLEKLYLNNCRSLFNLHESLGQLQQLVYLNLAFCPSLKKLPDTICRLSSLQKLILSHCSSLRELPESIGDLKESLVELFLDYTGIEALPDSFGLLKKLDVLDLSQCFELLDLSRSFENMTSLRFIHLSGGRAKLRNIPNLPSTLVELRLCEFVEAYSSAVDNMYNLKRLELLCLKTLCGKEEQFIRGVVRTSYIEFRKLGFGMRELSFGVVNHICVHYRWLTHSQVQSSPFLVEGECLRANNEGLRQIWIGLQDQRDEGLFRKYVIDDDDDDDDDDEICRRRLVMHVSMRVSGFDPIFARQVKGALRVKTTLEFKARIHGHKDQKISYCESSRLRFEDVEFINRDIHGVPKFRRFDYLNIECVHRFKGFDWFGFQLEGGDTIEILEVDQYHDPADEYGRERGIRCTVTELNLFLMKEDEEPNLKMFYNNPSSTTVAPNKKRRLTDQGEYCSEDYHEDLH
ncbi:disease resistance protein RUN1-like [Macadamia integrifolia]|uniref:disease resistance protein RUN1-like n=1 Tax=Macadamia integrifolia TaxID=60698 RepID=UPI001C5026B2|nr:disease resistance protein RUN1-like [Macadamia integrifolia]XP_042478081.1 disease resistance protein RUN1-like [Macadamia integrifolia]XP_042478087.1 disease resistance protein RUN1-like [Macadamia integrifolia]XP_042478095.1 disease resistance protein RUN1-like [Macadamia integrifolia]XP_042478102.1 disease resistance protein RUN1-like [Macadamia integrifolia]XP_042478111.1 disease resistance protein RUN1-like [Macadamia integrifolia]